jgi:hypothetical protein
MCLAYNALAIVSQGKDVAHPANNSQLPAVNMMFPPLVEPPKKDWNDFQRLILFYLHKVSESTFDPDDCRTGA